MAFTELHSTALGEIYGINLVQIEHALEWALTQDKNIDSDFASSLNHLRSIIILLNDGANSGGKVNGKKRVPREWCHDRDIKESRYYYWLRILRRDAVENKQQKQQVSPFVELPADICREQIPEPAAAVIRKGNITIEVTESASAGFIAKVMEALSNAW